MIYQGRKCKLVNTWFSQGERWALIEFADRSQLTVRASEVGL
jgi:hypothetical protein